MFVGKKQALVGLTILLSSMTWATVSRALPRVEAAPPAANLRILTDDELRMIRGGHNCNNAGSSGRNEGATTSDPVTLNSGNLALDFTDLSIPSLGPDLRVTRSYNSQIISRVEGWQPERGAGPWILEDNTYSGHGDRTISLSQWSDFTLSVDMINVQPGEDNPRHTARVSFRYGEDSRSYYVLIDLQGNVELSRRLSHIADESILLAYGTGTYDPMTWNRLTIEAYGSNIKVFVNDVLEIDYNDALDPILSGQVGLESFFSQSRFDNVVITDGIRTESHDFDYTDNHSLFGRSWTSNLDVRATEYSNGDVVILRANGIKHTFTANADGSYEPPHGVFDTLTKSVSGFLLRLRDGTEYSFDSAGRLLSIVDRNSNALTLSYGLIQGELKPLNVADAAGRALGLLYGPAGYVSSITDPIGREVQYHYDVHGNLVEVIDPNGNSRSYTYFDNHLLDTYTDPEGNSYAHAYYYNNRVMSQTDPGGNVTTFDYLWETTWVTNQRGDATFYHFDYEDHDQLVSVDDLLGNTEYFTYDEDGNRTSVTDKNGNVTFLTYDERGNVLSRTDGLGNTTSYSYEPLYNQVTSIVDPEGNAATFVHDARGNLLETTDALGNTTSFAYDPYGNVTEATDPLGNITGHTYDPNGNRTATTDPLGNVTQWSYDGASRLTATTDANGHTTFFERDHNDNLVKVTDALGNETLFSYDGLDRKAMETDAAGNQTSYEYDYAGEATRLTDAEGNETTFLHDLTNYIHLATVNRLSETDANGETTRFVYDRQSQLIETIDAEGGSTRFYYDPQGNLIKITDAALHDTHFAYDAANRLTATTYHDTLTEQIAYDANGNVIEKTDRGNRTTIFEYDELDRVTRRINPDLTFVAYSYDALGRLIQVSDSNGTTSFDFDALGRLASATYPGNEQVSYQYDPVGNRIQLTYPNHDVVAYSYDAANRLVSIQPPRSDAIALSYDELGRRIERDLPNGTSTTYEYDSLGRLTDLENSKAGGGGGGGGMSCGRPALPTTISRFRYTHDHVGNRLSTTTQDGTSTYTYDRIYQLTRAVAPDGGSVDYGFDAVGNRVVAAGEAYVTSPMNQYTRVGETSFYAYDADGNMESKTIDGWMTLYEYDHEDRLVKVTTPYSGTVEFDYDYAGRLTGRNENGEATKYVYDGDRVIAEIDSASNVEVIYVYGTEIDEVLAMERFSAGGSDYWYYNHDGLGSVREVMDAEGNVVERYDYDDYGSLSVEDESGDVLEVAPTGNRFAFTGREWDSFTGLYYYRARWYDPELGRFLQRDPIGYDSGDTNLYRYVGNNPVNLRDPLGLCEEDGDEPWYDPAQVLIALGHGDLAQFVGIASSELGSLSGGGDMTSRETWHDLGMSGMKAMGLGDFADFVGIASSELGSLAGGGGMTSSETWHDLGMSGMKAMGLGNVAENWNNATSAIANWFYGN